jgi:hypothetical protein
MDDRQTKIREGAGLEDSRINREFLDFLNKWSSPVLLTLATGALVWAGLQWLERKQIARVDQAFSEYEAAISGGNPSPTSLTSIASTYSDVRSVSELARLNASDIYLRSATTGVRPGAQPDQLTRAFNADDLLSDAEKSSYLDLAQQEANTVLQATAGDASKAVFAMQALSRLAAVAESKRDFDGARGYYDRLKALSTEQMYQSIASYADARIQNLDVIQSVEPLPTRADVPLLPGESAPLTQEQLDEMMQNAMQQMQDNAAADADAPADLPTDVPGDGSADAPAADAPTADEPTGTENP